MERKQKNPMADIWHKNAYALQRHICYIDTVKKWVPKGIRFYFLSEVSKMRKCHECGAKIRRTDSFCPKCGVVLESIWSENGDARMIKKDATIFCRIAAVVGGAVLVIAACTVVIVLL